MCNQSATCKNMTSNEETFENINRRDCKLDTRHLGDKQSIKALDLSRKSLKELPLPMLKEYKSLKCLYLEKNLLKELPEEMFLELPFLSWLDVRNNQLIDIPKSVANHEFLEVILLQGNHIQALPLELGLVPKLRGLQISGNPLHFPPDGIICQGISSILAYLRDECKTCSTYTKEEVNDYLTFQHSEVESGGSLPESLQDSCNYSNSIRRNTTTGCITHCQCTPKAANKDSVATKEWSTEEHNQISNLPKQETPMCKSSIRVMTNPKPCSTKVRNSAPVLSRMKTVKATGRIYNNKAASNNKHTLMRHNAIIQKRKSEEALKSWRDQMRKMKEKSSNLKNCMPTKEKLFPYDTDSKYMKMPNREELHNPSLDVKEETHRNSSMNSSSANIGNEISLIFKSLQSLKCTKEKTLSSPRSQQKAAKDKLLKINELNSAIGDLKKKMVAKGP